MNTTQYLNEIEQGFQAALETAKATISKADEAQLHLPEAPGKWNMLQCLQHLTLATRVYTENVKEALSTDNLAPASPEYKGHWKGRMFAKMNAPKPGGEIPMKVKTFKTMEPPPQLDSREVIDAFFAEHEYMIELINESRAINIDKVKVATALGSLVKLRLGEAYRFLLAHTQRHIVQLQRIKNTVAA